MAWSSPLASFTLHSNHRTGPLSPYAVGPLLSRVHTRHRRPRGAARVRPTNPTSTTATSSRGSTPPERRRSRPSTARRCRAPRPPRPRTRSSTARLLPSQNRGAAAVTLFTIARLHGIRSFDRASLCSLGLPLSLSHTRTHTLSLSFTHFFSNSVSYFSRAFYLHEVRWTSSCCRTKPRRSAPPRTCRAPPPPSPRRRRAPSCSATRRALFLSSPSPYRVSVSRACCDEARGAERYRRTCAKLCGRKSVAKRVAQEIEGRGAL